MHHRGQDGQPVAARVRDGDTTRCPGTPSRFQIRDHRCMIMPIARHGVKITDPCFPTRTRACAFARRSLRLCIQSSSAGASRSIAYPRGDDGSGGACGPERPDVGPLDLTADVRRAPTNYHTLHVIGTWVLFQQQGRKASLYHRSCRSFAHLWRPGAVANV